MEAYKQLNCVLDDPERTSELIALLSTLPFESFEVTANGCNAYLPETAFEQELFFGELTHIQSLIKFDHEWNDIPGQNWNAIWESNYEPIDVSAQLGIRAPHHDSWSDNRKEIIIQPQMSFGTGHHATTRLVLRMMENTDIEGKRVLDAGCGTGVLGIFAAMSGARETMGFDFDEVAINNARENVERNNVKVEIIQAKAELFKWRGFDLILANINRNAILKCLPDFGQSLNKGGTLILSGLLKADEAAVKTTARKCGLTDKETSSEDEWISIRLGK